METVRRSWKLQEFVAHKANVNCLAMGHKSNQVLATGGDDKKVNLWAIGRQSCLMSLSGHTTPVECVCFGHSEDLVCAGSQTGALKIWDLEAAKLLRTFTGHKGAIKCMDFHPYGDYLTTGSCDSTIKLWDTRKRGCIVTYNSHRLAVNSIQFSPDGQWIASACEDGLVKVWDVRVSKVLHEFAEHEAAVTCVKFHPREFLLSSCAADQTINFWDMEKFTLVSKFQKENNNTIRHIVFSDDGHTLLCGGSDGLHVVGWEPTRLLDVVPSHWGAVQDVTVAQSQLIAGSFHSTYVVLSVVDLDKVYPFGGPPPAALPTLVKDSSPFQKGHTTRKSFSKQKPTKEVIRRTAVLDSKTVEESASGTEPEEELSNVIPNQTDYTEVFKPSRALNRTPPPESKTKDEYFETGEIPTKYEAASLRSLLMREASDATVSVTSPLKPPPTNSPPHITPSHSPPQRSPLSSSPPHRPPTSTSPLHRPSPSSSPPQRQPRDTHHNASPPSRPRDYYSGEKSDIYKRVMESKKQENYTVAPVSNTNSKASSGILSRHNSYKESKVPSNGISGGGGHLRNSNTELTVEVLPIGPRSLSFTHTATETSRCRNASVETNEQGDEPEFVPYTVDRPVGIDLDEFLPRISGSMVGRRSRGVSAEPSEQEVLGVIMRGHDSMMAVLAARQRSLQIFNTIRINKTLKSALESVIALEDQSVILDILNIMGNKPSLWNLDICLLMLPKIYELLQSKYESYMQCGCNALRLIIRNFSSVVRSNVSAPVRTLGVDIPREERYAKCTQIHQLLLDVRAFLLKRQTLQGRLGATFRDLHTLMQQGLD